MMRKIGLFLFIVVIGATFLPLNSQETGKKEKEKKYSSSTSLSSVLARGNNRTFSFSVDTDHNFLLGRNLLNLKGSVIYSDQNSGRRSEIYYSHLKYDLKVSSRAYLLGLVRAEREYPGRVWFSLRFFPGRRLHLDSKQENRSPFRRCPWLERREKLGESPSRLPRWWRLDHRENDFNFLSFFNRCHKNDH